MHNTFSVQERDAQIEGRHRRGARPGMFVRHAVVAKTDLAAVLPKVTGNCKKTDIAFLNQQNEDCNMEL